MDIAINYENNNLFKKLKENEISYINNKEKTFYVIKCLICTNILSRSIEKNFFKNDDNKKYSYISYYFFISIKTSKKKILHCFNSEQDYFIYKKISCYFCRNKIGKLIISATKNVFNYLQKVKIDNKSCGL